MTGSRVPRNWRPGRHFGRRLTRLPPLPRPEVPLYALGTAVRIERVRLLYLGGVPPAAVVHETPIIQNGFVPSPAANNGLSSAGMARRLRMTVSSRWRTLSRGFRPILRRAPSPTATMRAREAMRLF